MKRHEKIDFYLAQLTAEVQRGWADPKEHHRIKAENFLLKFADKPVQKRKYTKEERTRIAKSFWLGRVMGTKKTSRKKGK